MSNLVNRIIRYSGYELRRCKPTAFKECVSIKTEKSKEKGNALIAYILEPFLLKPEESHSQSHTHHAESLLIAQSFLEQGYNVDVIDYRNALFTPVKEYSFFVSARTNFVKLAEKINKDCIKIAHLDTAHFLFNNAMAYRRLLNLQLRRGVTNTSIRVIEHNFAAEYADYLTMLGNDFTRSTYSYAGKIIFPLPVPTPNTFPYQQDKNFSKCKNRFLWLGSGGLVHKGLDLVLEVFSEMPECHLTVCGPIDDIAEREFNQAFHRELYQIPNIETVGWVDVSSQKFIDIANNCSALIYPSCSEGQSGAVITALQAGIIPVISYESGVDVDDFGIIMNSCSYAEIQGTIKKYLTKSNKELAEMSRKAYKYAMENHTKENYLQEFNKVIKYIEDEKLGNNDRGAASSI